MTSAFASFARKNSTGVKLKSAASLVADMSYTARPKGAIQAHISGSILEPHWFPILSSGTGGVPLAIIVGGREPNQRHNRKAATYD